MKKIISILSMAFIFVFCLIGLSGCGNSSKNDESSESNETTEIVEDSSDFINDNDSYFFIFDGKKFTAGDSISDLENVNLSVRDSDKEQTVPANKYMIGAGYIVNSDGKQLFQVTPYNTESTEVLVPEASIGGFTLDEYYVTNDSRLSDIEVYGGIKLGSTEEELKAVFGEEPSSVYEGDNWTKYEYDSDKTYRSYEFRVDEGKVIYIKWQNLVFNN